MLNTGGWIWDLYDTVPYYDDVAHFLTAFSIMFFIGMIIKRKHVAAYLWILFMTSIGISIGVVWEIVEWAVTRTTSFTFSHSLDDTVIDLIMDTIGAYLAANITYYFRVENRDYADVLEKTS
jgi:uncharacterized membrane protein YjdF